MDDKEWAHTMLAAEDRGWRETGRTRAAGLVKEKETQAGESKVLESFKEAVRLS